MYSLTDSFLIVVIDTIYIFCWHKSFQSRYVTVNCLPLSSVPTHLNIHICIIRKLSPWLIYKKVYPAVIFRIQWDWHVQSGPEWLTRPSLIDAEDSALRGADDDNYEDEQQMSWLPTVRTLPCVGASVVCARAHNTLSWCSALGCAAWWAAGQLGKELQSKILTGEFIATIEFGTNIVNYTKF